MFRSIAQGIPCIHTSLGSEFKVIAGLVVFIVDDYCVLVGV